MTQTIKNNVLLICFIILKMVLQYRMIAPGFELHRDEYLHLDQAHHLAWGFTSVPPVTSWISSVIYLLGNSVFWVKFFPALFGALTIVLVWKSIEALNGGYFARILGAFAVLCSAYMRINTLYQPNSLDILCWTFLFYCIIRYIQTEKNVWVYLFAIGFAVGFLNKYNIVFLLIGLMPALLLTGYRSLFKNKSFYLAAGIALLLILPNLIWQFGNDFPVVKHMEELSLKQLVHVDRLSILKEQLLFFLPSLFVIIFSFIGIIFYKPFTKFRAIGLTYIFTMALFVYLKGKAYYALGLYPVLFAFGSVYLEQLMHSGWKRYLRPVAIVVIIAIGIFYIPVICPVYSPSEVQANPRIIQMYKDTRQLGWEDGKEHAFPQDYADMLGWKELAALADSAWLTLSVEERKYTLVLCDNYGEAGAVNYYSKNQLNSVCYAADYKNWFPEKEIHTIILVLEKGKEKEDIVTGIKNGFMSVSGIGSIKNPMACESGTSVLLLRNAFNPFSSEQLKSYIANNNPVK